MKSITDVLVVGDDCDGLLAAITLRVRIPQLRVQVLRHRDPNDFRPDGFAASPDFLNLIHQELGIPPHEFMRGVRPTWRLGTRYHWGPREFFDYTYEFQIDTMYLALRRETGFYVGDTPRAFEDVGVASALMSQGRIFHRGQDGRPQIDWTRVGYHVERESLLRVLQMLAMRAGVTFRDGEITQVVRGEEGVAGIKLSSGESLVADLFIDATGAQSLLLGQTLNEQFQSFAGLLCDKAIVATCPRQENVIQPHSTVHTMEAGWSWRTEHERFIACGYAFSSRHISIEQAEAELRQVYPGCGPLRAVNLVQGRRENAWSGNVVAIGNAAGFVEPLAAAGFGCVAFQCQSLARSLVDCDLLLRPTLIKQFNKRWRRLVDGERDFLGLFYRYNTRLNSAFWQEARQSAVVGELDAVVQCYQDVGPDSLHRFLLLHENDPIGLEGYFSVLVGQSVPWNLPWRPPAEELEKWDSIKESARRKAFAAYTVKEACNLFFQQMTPAKSNEPRVVQAVA